MKRRSRLARPLVKRSRAFFKAYKGLLADVLSVGTSLLFLWSLYERFGRGLGWAGWTGFGGETLLDWLDLLIIPIFIAVGAWWLDRRQKKVEREFEQARLETDREIAHDRRKQALKIAKERRKQDLKIAKEKRQDATLEAYFDRMTVLLLEEGLGDPDASEKVKKIARMRTRVVLRRLDGKRNGHVIRFLEEAGLLSADDPLVSITEINLRGADLDSIDLAGSDLSSADLQEARLGSANLRGANLNASDLRRSILSGSNLSKAALRGTKLGKVWLVHARLRGADLSWADLQETKLVMADLRGADLRGAENLEETDFKGAKLDGAKVWARDVEALKRAGANLEGIVVTEGSDLGE